MAHFSSSLSVLSAALLGAVLHTGLASAQPSVVKTVVAEPTGVPVQGSTQPGNQMPGVFVIFNQWVDSITPPAPTPWVDATVTLQEWVSLPPVPALPPVAATSANAPSPYYEPAPVILGQPDLPLLGQAAAQAAQQWSTGLNYQGATVSFILLDAQGKNRTLSPASRPPAVGERFKIRYTASFDSVASIDKLAGSNPWQLQRAGQAWPQAGMSVQAAAGETVELPLNANNYFVMTDKASERFILHIRHPQAKDKARSSQPLYRQDGVRTSQYLQLIPQGTHPALEQLITPR